MPCRAFAQLMSKFGQVFILILFFCLVFLLTDNCKCVQKSFLQCALLSYSDSAWFLY